MSVHRIVLRAIAHATEDLERVKAALAYVSGSEKVETTVTKGHFGNPITVLESTLKKGGDIKIFVKSLADAGIIDSLRADVESRMDEECTFHFRLDKQAAYTEVLELAAGKDVVDCAIKVAAYPARRDIAISVLGDLFDDF